MHNRVGVRSGRRSKGETQGGVRARRALTYGSATLLAFMLASACSGEAENQAEGGAGGDAVNSGGTSSASGGHVNSASGGHVNSGGSGAPTSGGRPSSEPGGAPSAGAGMGGGIASGGRASAGAAGDGTCGGPHEGGAPGGGGGDGGCGGFWDGVGVGQPAMLCGTNALAGGVWCSAEAACATLGCGKPWSLFDENGCHKTLCSGASDCSPGERCLPPPVAGNFEQTFAPEYESCGVVCGGECRCTPYTDGLDPGVCVSEAEFPRDRECALEGLSCQALERAAATLQAYTTLDFGDGGGGAGPDSPRDLVHQCQQQVESALADCP